MLDLGATVCTARSPSCGACPVAGSCAWSSSGNPEPDPAIGSAGSERPPGAIRGIGSPAARPAAAGRGTRVAGRHHRIGRRGSGAGGPSARRARRRRTARAPGRRSPAAVAPSALDEGAAQIGDDVARPGGADAHGGGRATRLHGDDVAGDLTGHEVQDRGRRWRHRRPPPGGIRGEADDRRPRSAAQGRSTGSTRSPAPTPAGRVSSTRVGVCGR